MFEVKEVRNRCTKGISFPIADGVSIEDFPFVVVAKAPPFAFGKIVALVCGDSFDDAYQNALQIMQSLKISQGLVNLLSEVKESKIK